MWESCSWPSRWPAAAVGGSSDEDEVVAVAKRLSSAARRHDGRALCREILHPNTVHAVERLARAQEAPGGPRISCEQRYRTSQADEHAIAGLPPKPDQVTIKGDVAYLPDGDSKRPLARRVGDRWKVDFTVDPANAPAQDLAASLKRLNFQLEGAATSLRRGGTLEDATSKAASASRDEAVGILRAAGGAGVECGRIPDVAADGAGFRRKANAICAPIATSIRSLPDPGSSATAATRFLRRASALERRAGRRLAALKPPDDLDRVYRGTLSTLAGLGATLRAEGAAVSRRDVAGARRAVAKLGPLDYRKSSGFDRLGLARCARL